MDKSVAGVLTTVTALTLGQAYAAPASVPAPPQTMQAAMQASSYAELLQPIPNALALLQAQAAVTPVQKIAFSDDQPADHHHHHHHHHDQHAYVPPPPPPPPPHHHHHHHHHNHQV